MIGLPGATSEGCGSPCMRCQILQNESLQTCSCQPDMNRTLISRSAPRRTMMLMLRDCPRNHGPEGKQHGALKITIYHAISKSTKYRGVTHLTYCRKVEETFNTVLRSLRQAVWDPHASEIRKDWSASQLRGMTLTVTTFSHLASF